MEEEKVKTIEETQSELVGSVEMEKAADKFAETAHDASTDAQTIAEAFVNLATTQEPHIRLSVIIPYYNTPFYMMEPLLASIDGQIGVDMSTVEVLIVDDKSTHSELTAENLNRFAHIKPKVIRALSNGGPGIARQIGIQNAKGDYMIFCDSDDVIHSVGVFSLYYDAMKDDKWDLINTSWLEEKRLPDGRYTYITHQNDNTWLHGKVYRRAYINENHISFHPELRIQEDSYFNGLAFHFTEKKTYIDSLTYVWKWVDTSITRSNDAEYQYSGMAAFIRAIDLMLEEIFVKSGGQIVPSSVGTVCQVLYYLYFLTQCNHWRNIDQKWLDMLAEATAKFYVKYIGFYMNATEQEKQIIYHRERQRMTGQNLGIETETFDQYMNRILAKYAPEELEQKEEVEE